MKPVYVFDLDHTLIKGDTSSMWCKYMVAHNLVDDKEAFLAREYELMLQYRAGVMKVEDYIEFSTKPLENKSCDFVDQKIEEYVNEVVKKHIFKEGYNIIKELKAQGERVMIISASADIIVKKVAKLFDLADEDVIAVNVERKDGHYVGKIIGTPSFKEGKVACLRAWQEQNRDYKGEVIFYTDSLNDLPLCLESDEVFAVNPAFGFEEVAKSKGFNVLAWDETLSA